MYKIELTISYTNYSTGATTSNERFVGFDPSKITLEKNNNNGRDEKKATGSLEISGEDYIELFSWDDTLNFLDGIVYNVYHKDTLIVDAASNANLTFNSKAYNKATISLNSGINDIYTTFYNSWMNKEEVSSVTAVGTVRYYNNRVTLTRTTTEFDRAFNCLKNENGELIADVQNYISTKQSDTNWTLISIEFSYVSGDCTADTLNLDISMDWEQIAGNGYYRATKAITPAGLNWNYKDDVVISTITYPRFMKPKYYFNEEHGLLKKGKNCVVGKDLYFIETYTWEVEDVSAYIDYVSVGRKIEDVIEYLVGEIDATVAFNANSFYSFVNYTGPAEYKGLGTSAYDTLMFVGLPDFIPSIKGFQKTVISTVMEVSLQNILQWFEVRGFYWYFEDIAGTYYFRLRLIEDKALLSGNPDLRNYYGNDWINLSESYNVKEYATLRIDNETLSSDYNFKSEFIRLTTDWTNKAVTVIDDNIYTDVNYIVDAKSEVFNETATDNWVMLATTLNSGVYKVRQTEGYITEQEDVNNNELSFTYLVGHTFANLPAGSDLTYLGDTMSKAREEKINELPLQIPIDSFFDDFDFFEFVLINGEENEIDNMKLRLDNNFTDILLKK